MHSLAFAKGFNNSKLFFSKNELEKILSCYALGVSEGKWKDYAINYNKDEAIFFMFKHTLAHPDCVVTKSKKSKKSGVIFNLKLNYKKNSKSKKIDDLIIIIKRKHIKLL
tara:strand:+ start:123 stop:452 length:330 start_codon:yes stop_codon:yes gene_type:complete